MPTPPKQSAARNLTRLILSKKHFCNLLTVMHPEVMITYYFVGQGGHTIPLVKADILFVGQGGHTILSVKADILFCWSRRTYYFVGQGGHSRNTQSMICQHPRGWCKRGRTGKYRYKGPNLPRHGIDR